MRHRARDISAIFKAAVVASILLGIALGAQKLGFQDSTIGTFTLLCGAFLVVFAITSERLQSLAGPSGFALTFREYLESSADSNIQTFTSKKIEPMELVMVQKGRIDEVDRQLRGLGPSSSAALVLQLGSDYQLDALRAYENAIMRRRVATLTVIFVDQDGRYQGHLRPVSDKLPMGGIRVLQRDLRDRRFREPPEDGQGEQNFRPEALEDISRGTLPRMALTEHVDFGISRLQVLNIFARGSDHVLVLDDEEKPAGIILREAFLKEIADDAKRAESQLGGNRSRK